MTRVGEILEAGPGPVAMSPAATASAAARVMAEGGLHCVLVADKPGTLYGLLTDRDLEAVSRDGAESASVGELCRRDPVAVSADDEVKIAREVMRANHLEHLPVVDAEGKALGVITAEDLDQASGS